MRPDTRITIHMGVNFNVAPIQTLDHQRFFQLQQRLSEEKIEISQANRAGNQFVLGRIGPTSLHLQVGMPNPPAGQFLIIAAVNPATGLSAGISPTVFGEEASIITDVLREVWPETQQIINRDAALRMLFDCGGKHAFQYLWESKLHQTGDSLKMFGRPMAGGGLRLVFPPTEEKSNLADVKIESFLADASKLVLEVNTQWGQPESMDALSPREMMDEAERTAAQLIEFMNE